MLEFTVSGREYFDDLPQPVVVYGLTIEYCNPAARSLFSALGISLDPGGPVPPQLPPPGCAPCALTLELNRRLWSAQLRRLDAGVLCQLSPIREEGQETLDQLRRLSLQLRLRLSRTALSVERLQAELSELEQLRSAAPVARVNRSFHQLLRLSDHLDLYTRSDEELSDLYPASALNLNELCGELSASLTTLAGQQGHRFRYEEPSEELCVRSNPELLRRLLYNLIANALGAGGDLHLRLRRGGESALLTLTDTGGGIEPARLAELFTLDRETERGDFALGLPLSRRIVQLYGGQLMLSSDETGTTASLSLPLCGEELSLHAPLPAPEPGYSLLLTELSDVLDEDAFAQEDVF